MTDYSKQPKWMSKAYWPATVSVGSGTENVSTDLHHTYEAARNVCNQLELHGMGMMGNVFPLKTEVEILTGHCQRDGK